MMVRADVQVVEHDETHEPGGWSAESVGGTYLHNLISVSDEERWISGFQIGWSVYDLSVPSRRLTEWLGEAKAASSRRIRQLDELALAAAAVLEDDLAVRLLARLHQDDAELSDLGIGDQCRALARLAAAGMCDLGELKARITPRGRRFIDSVDQA